MESKVEVESEGRYNGSKERTLEKTKKKTWKFQRFLHLIYVFFSTCVCVLDVCCGETNTKPRKRWLFLDRK